MRSRAAMPGVLLLAGLMVCVSPAIAQNSSQASTAPEGEQDRAYATFFREVVAAPATSELRPVLLNGDQQIEMYQPSPKELLGLNDEESKLLREAASECVENFEALARATSAWRREAMFQKIESGAVSPELERRMQSVQAERSRIVSETLERVKNGLSASRFEAMNDFIRSKPSGRNFFPVVGSTLAETPKPRR